MFNRFFINPFRPRPQKTFQFRPRWKEELVVSSPGGSFILELPMGVYAAYLPTQRVWETKAPEWARDLWPLLKTELEDWCTNNNAEFYLDDTASVSAEE